MLNSIIKFALNSRLLVVVAAIGLIVYGLISSRSLTIDVLPEITRPRVAIITECPGLSPEEVELLVTFPLESALNGGNGVQNIRSSSDIGLSVIQVEFDWNQDVYQARQVVQERLASVLGEIEPYQPLLAPNSTMLGQIMMVGLWSEDGSTDPIELRTIADWTIRKRLMQIEGVAQVLNIGGGTKQFQVLIDPHKLHQFEISVEEVESAIQKSNLNVAGGYLEQNANETLIRGIGRVGSAEEIGALVIKKQPVRSILVRDIGKVVIGERVKRGDASVNGRPAVVLTIQKQPEADTRRLSQEIHQAMDQLRAALPPDVELEATYEQRHFIDYSVGNVIDAIRDGTILVVIVLFLFLFNFRTTVITLTAIPLSLITSLLVFQWFDMTINVMTLGGIAVALGELVDDAIVDVENIFKRLKQNAQSENPVSAFQVVFEASSEVRGAILNSTIIVILAFAPLYALSGIEGRLFAPLGIAYTVSILASTVVSLTVTPVLAYYLLPKSWAIKAKRDGFVLRLLKWVFEYIVRFSLTPVGFGLSIAVTLLVTLFCSIQVWMMGKDFLPPFDEGSSQVNLFLPAGASLKSSLETSKLAAERLDKLVQSEDNPEGIITWYTARNGRADNDEHVMGVNVTEITISLVPDHRLTQDELAKLLEKQVEDVPGVEIEVEQPIKHLISHMVSGVTAEIGVKIYGEDLVRLRTIANEVADRLRQIDGLSNPIVEQQQMIPQLRIEVIPEQLAKYGVNTAEVHLLLETALNGKVISKMLVGQKEFDILVRYDDEHREDLEYLRRIPIELPNGTRVPVSELARIYKAQGPNRILRDESQRRIIVRVNTLDRDLSSAVAEIEESLESFNLPEGYYAEIGGQYLAQQSAMRTILLLGCVSLIGIMLVLYSNFQSISHVLQTLIAIPVGYVGAVFALSITGQTLSVAAAVGFISLGGIVIRNGILLLESFRKQQELMGHNKDAIVRGSLDRLAPVLMTTLTTGFGLLPLVIGGNLPGKEILFPVATVILGGLIASAVAEYLLRPGLFYYLDSKSHED